MNAYSVKSVKTFRGMEGEGYNATLCRNGVPVALVIDDATGGEIRFEWNDWKAARVDVTVRHYQTGASVVHKGTPEEALFAEYVMSLPMYEFYGKKSYHNFDTAIGEIMNAVLVEKQYTRWCKTKTCFRLKGDKEGAYRTIAALYTAKIKAELEARHGNKLEVILNEKYGAMVGTDDAENARIRKLCKKGIVLRLIGKPAGTYTVIRLPYNPVNVARVKSIYGAQIEAILNERVAA